MQAALQIALVKEMLVITQGTIRAEQKIKSTAKQNNTKQKISCLCLVVFCFSDIAKRTCPGWSAGKKVKWSKAKCSQLSRLVSSSSATAGRVPEEQGTQGAAGLSSQVPRAHKITGLET